MKTILVVMEAILEFLICTAVVVVGVAALIKVSFLVFGIFKT